MYNFDVRNLKIVFGLIPNNVDEKIRVRYQIMFLTMEFKKLNSEVIKLFDKLNKSFDNKSASLNERVNILDHKIDHIISFFDHINYQSRVSNNSRPQRNKKIIN